MNTLRWTPMLLCLILAAGCKGSGKGSGSSPPRGGSQPEGEVQLTVLASDKTADTIILEAGKSRELTLRVRRQRYDGEVRIDIAGPADQPEFARVEPATVVIPTGKDSTTVKVTAGTIIAVKPLKFTLTGTTIPKTSVEIQLQVDPRD